MGGALALAVPSLMRRMDEITEFERLPVAFGPFVCLGPKRDIPDGVTDALVWLEGMIQ